jgi:hypothetical protein
MLGDESGPLQAGRLNHTSAASGVAYAETCGATTLSNWWRWTESLPEVLGECSCGCAICPLTVGISGSTPPRNPSFITK